MPTVRDSTVSLKPTVIAAVLLLALDLCRQLAMSWPRTMTQVLAATDTTKTQAYEMRTRLIDACASLHGRVGRPPRPVAPDAVQAVLRAVRDHLIDQPGAVSGRGRRRSYTQGFRSFVVGLAAPGGPGARLSIPDLADAAGVPLGTLKDWLVPSTSVHGTEPELEEEAREDAELGVHPHIVTILAEFRQWTGNFVAFCEHLREHHRIPYKRTFINTVLVAARLRAPKRRGQPVMAPWSRDTLERFFPGAQWFGDGTELAIEVNGQRYVFNFQAVVDGATNAIVGIDVSDVEDEHALLNTVHHGRVTTGESVAPMALTVDGKPCNHTPLVQDSIAPTEVLQATLGRGQAKAPVEGTFGLFQQSAPPLIVGGDTPREQAGSFLALLLLTWTWARNGRPRRRLGNRSPADAYRDKPSADDIRRARAWIAEYKRRSDRDRRTKERRADPVRRRLIREALARFDIDDPDARLEIAIASYSTEAIERGIAVFGTKLAMGTVPPEADPGRYLAGVVRNTDSQLELELTAQALLQLRLRRQDLTLKPLQHRLQVLQRTHSPNDLPKALVTAALDDVPCIDVRFFTRAAAEALASLPESVRRALLPTLVRTVGAAIKTTKQRRHDLNAALTQAATQW